VQTYEAQPASFAELLGLPQVGAKTIRAVLQRIVIYFTRLG